MSPIFMGGFLHFKSRVSVLQAVIYQTFLMSNNILENNILLNTHKQN